MEHRRDAMEGRDAFGLGRSKPLTGMEPLLGHECRANGNGTNHQALWVAHRARIQERQVAVVASRRRFRAPTPFPARDRTLEPEDPDVVPQPSPSPPMTRHCGSGSLAMKLQLGHYRNERPMERGKANKDWGLGKWESGAGNREPRTGRLKHPWP